MSDVLKRIHAEGRSIKSLMRSLSKIVESNRGTSEDFIPLYEGVREDFTHITGISDPEAFDLVYEVLYQFEYNKGDQT